MREREPKKLFIAETLPLVVVAGVILLILSTVMSNHFDTPIPVAIALFVFGIYGMVTGVRADLNGRAAIDRYENLADWVEGHNCPGTLNPREINIDKLCAYIGPDGDMATRLIDIQEAAGMTVAQIAMIKDGYGTDTVALLVMSRASGTISVILATETNGEYTSCKKGSSSCVFIPEGEFAGLTGDMPYRVVCGEDVVFETNVFGAKALELFFSGSLAAPYWKYDISDGGIDIPDLTVRREVRDGGDTSSIIGDFSDGSFLDDKGNRMKIQEVPAGGDMKEIKLVAIDPLEIPDGHADEGEALAAIPVRRNGTKRSTDSRVGGLRVVK